MGMRFFGLIWTVAALCPQVTLTAGAQTLRSGSVSAASGAALRSAGPLACAMALVLAGVGVYLLIDQRNKHG